MNKEILIREIDQLLAKDKVKFLNNLKADIYNYVSNRSCAECLTIVENGYLWEPSDALDGYIPRFISFIRGRKYNGKELDSALTERIVSITTSSYNEHVQIHSTAIVKPVLEELLNNKVVIESLAAQIVDKWKGTISVVLRKKLVAILVHKIEESIGDNIVHASSSAVTTICSKVVAVAVSIPISKSIAILLAKNMAIMLKGVIAKVLASATFKTMMATMVKKFVAAKIIAIVISLIGAKMAGISIGWVLAPLIIAFIAYEINTLPRKMAEKISTAVVEELSGKFTSLNHNVSTSIASEIGSAALITYLSDVANDTSMRDILNQVYEEMNNSK